jgi:hypothetical protein
MQFLRKNNSDLDCRSTKRQHFHEHSAEANCAEILLKVVLELIVPTSFSVHSLLTTLLGLNAAFTRADSPSDCSRN